MKYQLLLLLLLLSFICDAQIINHGRLVTKTILAPPINGIKMNEEFKVEELLI